MKNKNQSSLDFKMMSFFFSIRDILKSPMIKVNNAGIKQGDIVLDYGCGPGGYTIAAANVLKDKGKVYAADINKLAIEKVEKLAEKKNLNNIETILTECDTGLNDNSIDIIICFDMLHDSKNPKQIIKEFHRILKSNAILSFDDHHSNEEEINFNLTSDGLFELIEKIGNQYNFKKV